MTTIECTRTHCWCKHVSLPTIGSLCIPKDGLRKKLYRITTDMPCHRELYLHEVVIRPHGSLYSRHDSEKIPICNTHSLEYLDYEMEAFHRYFKHIIIDEV